MKVVTLNYTGTVGKTTISAHVLSPRMNNAPIYAIESINETAEGLGIDVEKMTGAKFRDLFRKLMLEDDAVIDIGASNIEDFLNNMIKFDNSHEEFDYFIIPVTSGTKEQKETIQMLQALAGIGIPSDKIRVIFNRVDNDVEEEFKFIIAHHKKEKTFVLNTECAIFENEIFDALSIKGLTVDAILADQTDYKSLLKNKEASARDRNNWADMYGLKALAKGVKRNLDDVYANLF
ncbi:plasmid stability protein StbB [bacteria symbiont BFo1 of Frankliniella occidentalis]|uniref:StbB family protein n=1 Tax=Erwinia TaxID=551 RepID=UPI0006645AF0|nr:MULTISPECIES: StbB family protein [Erwinia]KMV67577.1 plasmid stability protein StbB [bacteria symbiont BFo1 of Frankliniella occidentalis]KYP82390.1 plasmid stability protein StbB [bacteria symbiont BFo1 of Frankliniella occidentalis]KYP87053.1 plasmid stability protein StbB [bacteria symbiont BFo1 of Frankliniella occidentalis]MDI3440210.1 StbB family protein [Erwinia sp. V90_4]CAH0296877.1 hypothetical protein SRABI13_04248 [Erwinia aphidicola]